MNSPVDEMTPPASLAQTNDATAPFDDEDTSFGQDEARLVRMANLEATLRLARAL